MNRILNGFAVVIFALVSGAVSAAGTDAFASPATEDADYKVGRAAIEAKNWKGAITSFNRAAGKFRDNPDIFNWLGYAHRKSGELDAAFKHYNTALRLDPKHLGAHEYIGEAYLLKRDLASAQKHLTALERLCNKVCEEYQDLAKSIAEFK